MTIFVLSEGSKAAPVGIGSKAGGIGSAAAGQAPPEGENVLTKILQGGAAEQAGKLGDGRVIHHFNFMFKYNRAERLQQILQLEFLHMFSSCHGRSFVWPWEEVHLILVKSERRVSLNWLYEDFIIGFHYWFKIWK